MYSNLNSMNAASSAMSSLADFDQTQGDIDMLELGDCDPVTTSVPNLQYHLQPTNPHHAPTAQLNPSKQPVNSAVGAGPLPTTWGTSPTPSSADFTKRRFWAKTIVETMRDLYLIISPELRIMHVSDVSLSVLGYPATSLRSKMLQDYIHPEDRTMALRDTMEAIASHRELRYFFRLRKQNEQYAIFEAHGQGHYDTNTSSSNADECLGVFIILRPYPTKAVQLLDSFLEHKIENQRLSYKIQELKREEREELEAEEMLYQRRDASHAGTPRTTTNTNPNTNTNMDPGPGPSGFIFDSMPPPPKPPSSSNLSDMSSNISATLLTQKNLSEALATHQPEGLNDKMSRIEKPTPLEHMELLTGLLDGERSEGISTGSTNPNLVRGDAGIVIPASHLEDQRGVDKKKVMRLADEYVCTDCGTLDSPEWRKGPRGPKTLCNACGLRWSKRERKQRLGVPPKQSKQSKQISPDDLGEGGDAPGVANPAGGGD